MRAWECVNKGQDSQIHYNASHGMCVVVKSNNELDTLNTVFHPLKCFLSARVVICMSAQTKTIY